MPSFQETLNALQNEVTAVEYYLDKAAKLLSPKRKKRSNDALSSTIEHISTGLFHSKAASQLMTDVESQIRKSADKVDSRVAQVAKSFHKDPGKVAHEYGQRFMNIASGFLNNVSNYLEKEGPQLTKTGRNALVKICNELLKVAQSILGFFSKKIAQLAHKKIPTITKAALDKLNKTGPASTRARGKTKSRRGKALLHRYGKASKRSKGAGLRKKKTKAKRR